MSAHGVDARAGQLCPSARLQGGPRRAAVARGHWRAPDRGRRPWPAFNGTGLRSPSSCDLYRAEANMAKATRPIPDGYHTVTPQLIVRGAARAIDFYARAFGAEEVMRMPAPGGERIMHAELRIGDSHIFLNDEFPDMGARSPEAFGGTPASLHLYVED